MSASDRSCSARSATSASFRCFANEASRVKEMAPAPMMFSANIVLGNQLGKSASGKKSSPATPVRRKTNTKATNQRMARRTSRKTRAPSGARIPHSATPDGEEPADEHLPGVRGEEDVGELGDEEKAEAAGLREDHQGAERDGEVDERGDTRQRTEADEAPHTADTGRISATINTRSDFF